MSIINVKNLHLAPMTTEDTAATAAVYGDFVALPGTIQADYDPKSNTSILYADGIAYEAAETGLGEGTLDLETADVPLSVQAMLFGHTVEKGVMIRKTTDKAPYVAVAYESEKANGATRYRKFYKVKFSEPTESSKTKDPTLPHQTSKISGKICQLKNDSSWDKTADTDAEGYEATTGSAWYTAV